MAIDIEEAFARGCWWLPRRFTFYLTAVWVGCMIGGASGVAGLLVKGKMAGPWISWMILGSPGLLASGWFCVNAFVLGVAFVTFLRLDALNIRNWGIFAGIESFFALAGALLRVSGNTALALVWGVWLLLLAMMITGLWFLGQWQRNCWAGELAILKAENATRRATRPNDAEPEEPLDL